MNEQRLTDDEARALADLPLPVDFALVRLHRGRGDWATRKLRSLVLRFTGGRGIALGNHVFLPDDCCESLPVLAHELTHCGQYQAWGACRYYIRAIADRVRELRYRRPGVEPVRLRQSAGPGVRAIRDGATGSDRRRLVSRVESSAAADHEGGSRSSHSANTFPSGSAIIAMMPHGC
jgi:hypothetical protein